MDVIEKVDEVVDLCKILHECLMFSDAKNENCSHAKTLSYIIYEKVKEVQKGIYS